MIRRCAASLDEVLRMMQTFIVSILAAATVIRILLVSSYFIGGGSGDILSQVLGPGILPAISASVLDPIQTWDHLAEACFWLDNTPSIWTTDDINRSRYHVGGYRAIYTPGTRIVAPPLVVAFLGETLVCPYNNNNLLFYLRKVIQAILLLVADIIGAYCIFHLGKRVLDMEDMTNEAEMERQTILSDQIITNDGDAKCIKQLVIPGILRPERGWIIDLPSKILPPEKVLIESLLNDDAVSNGNGVSSTIILDDRDPLILINDLPLVVAVLYYCNPISMIANANGSLRGLWDSFILLSFYYATRPSITISKEGVPTKVKSATMVAFNLSVAIYADVGYAVFMVPILLWRGLCASTKTKGTTFQRTQHFDWKLVFVLFIISTGALHYLASLLVGGDSSAYKTVLIQTVLPNIAFVQQDGSGSVPGPSMGLHWYMFVQMFDRFRPYFTVFVSGIPAMFIIPLTIRLYRYPLVLAATFQLLWAIFRPTTTAHTLTLGILLALLNPRTIIRMRNPSLISFCALPVPIILFITFHRMWLVSGNGNANYIYFQCLAYGMFVLIITMDFVSATVKRDKVRRMIEKGTIAKLLLKKKEGIESDDATATNASQPIATNNEGVDKNDDANLEPEPTVVFI